MQKKKKYKNVSLLLDINGLCQFIRLFSEYNFQNKIKILAN